MDIGISLSSHRLVLHLSIGQTKLVDFKKLRESKAKPQPVNPRDIFNGLPKPPGINDLYASQAEVLDAWYPRRADKDIVVKLHTGGGKTLVALLMAQAVMNETSEPVIYLAPTNQLVDQVVTKSRDYGISAVPYIRGQQFVPDFYDGKTVLVGSYQSLFNGFSKFGVRGSGEPPVKAGAIILDDAHVALSSVREAFSLTYSVDKDREVYSELAGRFRTAFADVNRAGRYRDITNGKDQGVVEVPSWAWHQKMAEVQSYLSQHVEGRYAWPLLRDNLAVCHCLFSRKSVTITAIFPPIDMLPTFADCGRRIYMSATIADDSEIVRTFGASADAVGKPITSTSLAGVGERMILVPGLMKLGGAPTTPIAKTAAKWIADHKAGVAILTSSGPVAKTWTDVAEYPETTDAVARSIQAMQSGAAYGPVVLANRYDGIDLAGNACRLLIMDDLPQGTTDYDLFRVNVLADSTVNSLLAQRIEQGIGRGTRGGADFCVVMLIGTKLVGWIGRKGNLTHLTASTRAQLKMGQEVSEAVASADEFYQTILKCLNRDGEWVKYHASELADAAHAAPIDQLALKLAGTERRAFRLQSLGRYEPALQTLEKLIDDPDLSRRPERRAWLSALAARVAYQMGDEGRGEKLQSYAFGVNNNHTPPKLRPTYVPNPVPGSQSMAIVSRLLEYERRGSLLSDFAEAVAELVPEASTHRYEDALANLGRYMGFEVERPDSVYGIGPDVLWRTDSAFDFVIEAKSDKDEANPLYKKDHAQLLEAEQWFKVNYPGRSAIRVSALPEAVAHEKATPVGSFALRLDDITKLVGALRQVLSELSECPGNADALRDRCEALLRAANLKPDSIKATFLVPFGSTPRKI